MNTKRPSLLLSEQILKPPFPQSPDSEDGLLCGAAFHPLSPLPSLLFISLHDNQCESPGRPAKHISPCWVFFLLLISLTFSPPIVNTLPQAPVLLLVRLSRARQQVNVGAGCHMLTRWFSLSRGRPQYVCLFVWGLGEETQHEWPFLLLQRGD